MVEIGEWIPLQEYRRLPAAPGLYIVRHKVSRLEYVGKSVNVRSRMYYHIRAKIDDTYFYRSIQKHGAEAFEVCLYQLAPRADLCQLEVSLIAERGTFSPGGYNTTVGGEGAVGRKFTEEQRRALSDRQRGKVSSTETRERTRQSMLAVAADRRGIPRTAEVRQKISQARTGKTYGPRGPASEKHRAALKAAKLGAHVGAKNPRARAVGAWAPEAMLPQIFLTSQDAAAHFNLPKKIVGRWCRQGHQPAGACSHVFAYI